MGNCSSLLYRVPRIPTSVGTSAASFPKDKDHATFTRDSVQATSVYSWVTFKDGSDTSIGTECGSKVSGVA